jgi:hypothetical protein
MLIVYYNIDLICKLFHNHFSYIGEPVLNKWLIYIG